MSSLLRKTLCGLVDSARVVLVFVIEDQPLWLLVLPKTTYTVVLYGSSFRLKLPKHYWLRIFRISLGQSFDLLWRHMCVGSTLCTLQWKDPRCH